VYYAYSDHLNAPRVIVNAAGDVRWRWISEPFGTTAAESIPNSLENLVVNLRFPGQYFDKESGLSYNYFRDYDGTTGRYVQSDPMGLSAGVNTYAYVESAPISATDPFGLMGGGGNHAKPQREYIPDKECMDFHLSRTIGPVTGLAKEFSVFSLFPNSYNIDDHSLQSAALTGGGTASKFFAYQYLSKLPGKVARVGAAGLHAFGEVVALPATAAATYMNAAVADRCTCEEMRNPGAWATARKNRDDYDSWINSNKPVWPSTSATRFGF